PPRSTVFTLSLHDALPISKRDPEAEFMVHPECGCASQAMAFSNDRTHILSTEKMIDFAKRSPKKRFLVATEIGIIHRLEKEAPGDRKSTRLNSSHQIISYA